ncbi:MAG: 2,3-bisphosphoglycerate-independent phosphoglycerate mutase [Candidatus Uhrbacteria bacterium GW2011_GWF2_39_13]|uniref:2,3-bisphosphoglycerate-independent phosphoglycerate mutase n=1 Tax=Candidatus Uhrbacteria bacterium GW2011_GWF2_39_13 TaxID=1618995 RepID=A0A0G0QS99_9BACT|nr:MAG: 2,3-bisphosphoglycerate-independent phosphoglycerate mutase [Candidatus Uhrbacteria bacterium GW2011_GWF2_39_13]
MSDKIKKPNVLIIVDGFGVAPDGEGNAITQSQTPNFDRFIRTYPTMTLRASGEEVGLSWGEMGNSEVGHLTIGAGRVYYQTFPRINRAMDAGEFSTNETFVHAFEHVKQHNSRLHLIGMVSQGRVHSMDLHCHALLQAAKEAGVKEVFIQAILDGRDTLYNVGIDFVASLQEKIQELGIGKIASVSGRYYAMDRDTRWDRINKAYNTMVLGEGEQTQDPLLAIKASYQKEIYDEEFVPTVIVKNGQPVGLVQDNDAVIFFNFRPDRMRELVKAFVLPSFDEFPRKVLQNLFPVTFVEYEKGLPVEIAFASEQIDKCLAQVLSEAGMTQLHIAETEKYAHVTFFLNGTKEDSFPGEERVIIPSPSVAAYNEAPDMSARKITECVIKEMRENTFDFMVMNFANPDMVGHTGDLEATIKAMAVVDECLGKIVEETLSRDGHVFITADHGNAEEMRNLRTGEMDKEHATNPVPFVIIGNAYEGQISIAGEVPESNLSLMSPVGMLADVAPTILAVMGIKQPPEMTGQSLL